jgi:hypothetical protein
MWILILMNEKALGVGIEAFPSVLARATKDHGSDKQLFWCG